MLEILLKELWNRHYVKVCICILINLFWGVEMVMSAYLLKYLLDNNGLMSFGQGGFLLIIIIAIVLKQILYRSYDYLRDYLIVDIEYRIRIFYLTALVQQGYNAPLNSAQEQTNLNNFVDKYSRLLFLVLERFLVVIWAGILAIILLATTSYSLATLILVMLLLSGYVSFVLPKQAIRYSQCHHKLVVRSAKYFQTIIRNHFTYFIYELHEHAQDQQNKHWRREKNLNLKIKKVVRLQNLYQGLLGSVVIILPWAYFLLDHEHGYQVSDLVFHYFMIMRLVAITWNIGQDLNTYQVDLALCRFLVSGHYEGVIDKLAPDKRMVNEGDVGVIVSKGRGKFYQSYLQRYEGNHHNYFEDFEILGLDQNYLKNINASVINRISCCDKVLIRGVSGIGKSTLLNHIFMRQKQANSALKVVYLTQDESFCWEKFKLFFKKFTPDLRNILDILGFAHYEYDESFWLRTFSGGEQQRLLMAPLFILKPDLLLLDEPMRGLDKLTWQRIIRLLLRHHYLRAVIITTHGEDCDNLFNYQVELCGYNHC